MAVYTKLNQNKIEEILSNYKLGKLDHLKELKKELRILTISYQLIKKFILTVYEKRVKSADLPFFCRSYVFFK